MTKILDPHKLSNWRKRLKRFHTSGQTVTKFCQHEKVTPSTFYYWSKRLRQGEPPVPAAIPSRPHCDSESDRLREPVAKTCKQPAVGAGPTGPMVHFVWNQNLQLSIPSHCLDAIRSVLEWSREGVAETPHAFEPASAFHQVFSDAC